MSDELPVWAWVSGWGVPLGVFEDWVAEQWPGYRHVVLAPVEGAVDELVAMECERVGGYSLGALLLLEQWVRFEGREGLMLAPYVAFCREEELGGKVDRRSLRGLTMRVSKSAEKGLRFFYDFAELSFLRGVLEEGLPYEEEGLRWGLEQLGCLNVGGMQSVKGLHFVFGDEDVFIEAERLIAVCEDRGVSYELKAGEGHDFRKLVPSI